MNDFLFVLGSNWQLSIAELDNVLKNSQYKGRIKDYSANVAIVEFDTLHEDTYYVDKLMELQFLLGNCQKIAKIYDFFHISTIFEAFPIKIDTFQEVEKARDRISNNLDNILEVIFPRIRDSNIFYAVSIYPILYDDKYYSEILVKHFLPFLNKKIMELIKQKGGKKTLYYKYPEENMKKGNLNPIFPHHIIKYELLKENRAEIIFGFTEEGVYIARTFTADDPNFKKKIDEERPHKDFKSSISPKLALVLLNFLNLFENREKSVILDPFVGNGTIAMFAILQDFQIYGSDFDQTKVKNTVRNINWFLNEIEEPIPSLLDKRFKTIEVEKLSNFFMHNYFDGICTEPFLGPFYKEKPYYIQVKELFDNDLVPLYEAAFREIYNLLKPKGRVSLTVPIISTIDGGDIQLDINKIASKYKYKLIPIIDHKRIINKSNKRLQFRKQHFQNLIEAKKGQILKRKIYIFEKYV